MVYMAKKRKTRKEKERAAGRKQARGKVDISSAVEQSYSDSDADLGVQPQSSKAINSPEDMNRHKERIGTMKLSLIVFSALVTVQLIIWGLDSLGLISLDFISL